MTAFDGGVRFAASAGAAARGRVGVAETAVPGWILSFDSPEATDTVRVDAVGDEDDVQAGMGQVVVHLAGGLALVIGKHVIFFATNFAKYECVPWGMGIPSRVPIPFLRSFTNG